MEEGHISYMDEYKQRVAEQATQWDLTCRNIQPDQMVKLFTNLADMYETHTPQHLFMVDLSGNRLMNASDSDYIVVLTTLSKCALLCVRFGFDTFLPSLEKAKDKMGADGSWHDRVFVDIPWIAQQRTQNQLEETGKQLVETDKRLRELIGWTQNADTSLESEATKTLMRELEDVVSFPNCRKLYERKQTAVEFDGVVFGRSKNENKNVLVLLEAKHRLRMEHVNPACIEAKVEEQVRAKKIEPGQKEDQVKKMTRKCLPARFDRYKELMGRTKEAFERSAPGDNGKAARILGKHQWITFNDDIDKPCDIVVAVAANVFEDGVLEFLKTQQQYWVMRYSGTRFELHRPNVSD